MSTAWVWSTAVPECFSESHHWDNLSCWNATLNLRNFILNWRKVLHQIVCLIHTYHGCIIFAFVSVYSKLFQSMTVWVNNGCRNRFVCCLHGWLYIGSLISSNDVWWFRVVDFLGFYFTAVLLVLDILAIWWLACRRFLFNYFAKTMTM